jgi:DNA primase catalytic subunit
MSINEQISNLSEQEAKDMLEAMIENSYSVISWPESQNYMEKEWFEEEAILDVDCKFGNSAYLIPTKYTF